MLSWYGVCADIWTDWFTASNIIIFRIKFMELSQFFSNFNKAIIDLTWYLPLRDTRITSECNTIEIIVARQYYFHKDHGIQVNPIFCYGHSLVSFLLNLTYSTSKFAITEKTWRTEHLQLSQNR